MDNVSLTMLSAFIGGAGGVGSVVWWLSLQFRRLDERASGIKIELLDRIEAAKTLMVTKIDDHEKLDQARFARMDEAMDGQKMALMKVEMSLQAGGLNPHMMPTPR